MTKDEALKMAIEAIEISHDYICDNICNEEHLITNDSKRHQQYLNQLKRDLDSCDQAIDACKEALEQPEGKEFFERGKEIARWADKQAQEPVAVVYSMQDGYVGQMIVKGIPHKTKLYTHHAPQPAQEPVAWMLKTEVMTHFNTPMEFIKYKHEEDYGWKPLYTHPHQWQGLSDNEKLASIRKWSENNTMRGIELIGLCDAIEQALKEKNHD